MPYRANPFLGRSSERTTSDQEFVRMFSPNILERLAEDAFDGAVHIFRSPPGAGKTTLFRAFTPAALRSIWNARTTQTETYHHLIARGVLDEQDGPQFLGVFLSCASGYADLPPGATLANEGLFRALFDCRVVLRSLRSLATLLGAESVEILDNVQLSYSDVATDLKSLPLLASATELIRWAEQRERSLYAELDSITPVRLSDMPSHVRFEGILWLQAVEFTVKGKLIAPKRLLMIDDLQKLRRKQRDFLISEITDSRPSIAVWIAERSIALGPQLLSQGAREGRDIREYSFEDLWGGSKGAHQFGNFAENILYRRLEAQSAIPPGEFSQYLRSNLVPDDVPVQIKKGQELFRIAVQRYKGNSRYREVLGKADNALISERIDELQELYVTRILLARDEFKRQMTLELSPLSPDELHERDSPQVRSAAEIFMHEELKLPYYFGIERLCSMATSNVEELLSLAAALYDGLQAKQVLQKNLLLTPVEQEKLLIEVAKRKRDFIPKNHTEGTRAQRLLDSVGSFCQERTFLPNAPYAPGVTGVRLSESEMARLNSTEGPLADGALLLRRVLTECVAENLLMLRSSSASTSRESGTIFFLNRTLCGQYGLPLQLGCWQDVVVEDLLDWMERGRPHSTRKLLERR